MFSKIIKLIENVRNVSVMEIILQCVLINSLMYFYLIFIVPCLSFSHAHAHVNIIKIRPYTNLFF